MISIGIGRLTRDSNRWNFEPVSIRSLNYSRRLNSSKMHRFQSWRLTYRKVRYCKNFFIRRFFFRTDALSFILFTRFYNGRSCANVACNLCWRLSYAYLFPLLFFFFLMLQVHARNSEFNLNLMDSGNCNRGSAIRTSNGRDMLHMFEFALRLTYF